jgi:hypothetical protein
LCWVGVLFFFFFFFLQKVLIFSQISSVGSKSGLNCNLILSLSS